MFQIVPIPVIGIISSFMECQRSRSEIETGSLSRGYIIVYTQANPSYGNEKMLNVFSENGLDVELFNLNDARIVKQNEYATIYEMDLIPERIQKAYPRH